MTSRRFLPLLLVLFVGSGCAALIYEIVWFQMLQLVIGSSAVSLGVLLGTFMGGMCLGSLFLWRAIPGRHHPLRVYALLEFGVGALGLLVLGVLPVVGRAYVAIAVNGLPGILLRGVLAAILLLPPTMLMGATLPAIARWVETSKSGVAWLGFFYGGNTAGAVFGCLLAGFYLLRVHDMPTATFVAVAINVVVAASGLALAALTTHGSGGDAPNEPPAAEPAGVRAVYLTIALSGMSALGAEVVWTRLLSLMLGGTTYTFSIILAVFLAGIGLGSSVGSYAARRIAQPRLALGVAQFLLVAAVAWTAWNIAKSLPFWPINPGLASAPRYLFELDFVRCLWAILPAACLWGASFPLALAAVASDGQDGARMVGRVYAANTVGAIVGALAFSMLFIPWVGTRASERLLIAIGALSALPMLLPLVRRAPARDRTAKKAAPPTLSIAGLAGIGAALVVAAVLAWSVADVPFELIAYGRQLPWRLGEAKELYRGEGMNASIAVSELVASGYRNFHVSGKIEASTEPQDMRLQRLLGNLPALVHGDPESVLVVGFGAGVTAGSFVPYPEMKRMVICELEPLIPEVVSTFFADENQHVLQDPRVQVVYDDARHYVLTTREKFDLITSDPIHPWVKGAATLYTKEYFEMVKAHLKPGGIVSQWVPLYESNDDAVKSEIATFLQVFPEGTVWGNLYNGEGYDVILLGQAGPTRIDLDAVAQRLGRPDHLAVTAALGDVGFQSLTDIFSTFAARGRDLAPWLQGAAINRDRSLRLQYLAGLTPDSYTSGAIYNEILTYRRFPADLFTGAAASTQALRSMLGDR